MQIIHILKIWKKKKNMVTSTVFLWTYFIYLIHKAKVLVLHVIFISMLYLKIASSSALQKKVCCNTKRNSKKPWYPCFIKHKERQACSESFHGTNNIMFLMYLKKKNTFHYPVIHPCPILGCGMKWKVTSLHVKNTKGTGLPFTKSNCYLHTFSTH